VLRIDIFDVLVLSFAASSAGLASKHCAALLG